MGTPEDLDARALPDQTDIIEVSEMKLKYINRTYRKVTSKMYDYNCDVKLVVGSETFKAHRDVLVDASDYFSAMFTHDMRERQDDVIKLQGVSPRGFASMIEYFYHGYVTVDPSNAEGVVEVARFFHIEWLIRIARHYLVCHLGVEDYVLVLQLAEQYVLGDLQSAIMSYTGNSFSQLSVKPKYLRSQFELLRDLLAGDWFISAREWEILQAVLRWLQHDSATRSAHQVALLELIRFPLLEPDELENLEEDITGIPEIAELISESRNYHSVPSQYCLLSSSRTEARGALPYLVLYSGIENNNVAEYRPLVADPSADIIHEEINTEFLEPAFEFAAVAVLGDCLFVAGGYNHKLWCSSASFYCYSPHRRSWAELSSMSEPRVSHSLCKASDLGLYAVAGINHHVDPLGVDREAYHDTVELYDPRDNLWHEAPRLPFAVFNCGAIFHDGRLFVTGGISDNPELSVPVSHVNCCRPTDNGWTILSDMIHPRHSHAIATLHDKIYIFGGLTADPNDTMGFINCMENEVYDPTTDQWTALAPTPIDFGRIHGVSLVIGAQIILLGSCGKENFSMHEFDEENGKILEGQPCGGNVHKMAVFSSAFPSRKLGELILSPI